MPMSTRNNPLGVQPSADDNAPENDLRNEEVPHEDTTNTTEHSAPVEAEQAEVPGDVQETLEHVRLERDQAEAVAAELNQEHAKRMTELERRYKDETTRLRERLEAHSTQSPASATASSVTTEQLQDQVGTLTTLVKQMAAARDQGQAPIAQRRRAVSPVDDEPTAVRPRIVDSLSASDYNVVLPTSEGTPNLRPGDSLNELVRQRPNHRTRGRLPNRPLDGTDARMYQAWRFQVLNYIRANLPVLLYHHEQVNYALGEMTGTLFSAMQDWVARNEGVQFPDFLGEVEKFLGVPFLQQEARRALVSISQRYPSESVTAFYLRLLTLWQDAGVHELERIENFIATLHPAIGRAITGRTFSTVEEVRDAARMVEQRVISIDSNHPRKRQLFSGNFPRQLRLAENPRASIRPSLGESASQPSSYQGEAMPSPQQRLHNAKFGPVSKKPAGWQGPFYSPQNNPPLQAQDRLLLSSQGRCYGCRGSGHVARDSTVCPRRLRLHALTTTPLEEGPDHNPQHATQEN